MTLASFTRFARRARWALVATLLLALTPTPPATAQIADAVLEVLVVDETDQVLPGVTVTIVRPDTGYQQIGVTDTQGFARVVALPPGSYVIKIELSGFTTVDQGGITLRVGQTLRVSVKMRVAQVAETVNVVGEAPLVDVYKTDSSTNIVPEQIEALPVAGRDFQRLAYLAPGVQRERGGFRFITNAPVIGAGGNASQAVIMVDGVDFTDPVLGLARARFSQNAISEFRVISNRFDSEIGGSAGGALSIVTKSGTNQFSGSAFAFFRDDALRAKSEFEAKKNDYGRQQFGFAIGGPIVRDRTHFFGSFEQINEDNIALFRPGGAYASLADDIPVPLDQSLFYVGLDHRFTGSQNLRAKFMYEIYRQENFRVGGVNDESTGMNLDRDNWNFTATHSWTMNPTSLNQLSVQAGRRKFDEPNNSSEVTRSFSAATTLTTGANIVGDQTDTGDIFEVRNTFFTRLGSGKWAQDLKIGGAWQHVEDTWNFPVYPRGWLLYGTDNPALPPLLYFYGEGSGESTITTDLWSFFIQDDFRPLPTLTINVGLRYDLDTDGNNPDFTSPLQPEARGRDTNNWQPRAGFSWDVTGTGRHVVRGGVGLFTGRYLLIPAHGELQQNSYTGWIIQQRASVAAFGLLIDPNNPKNTGFPLPKDATRIADELASPWATQLTGGYTFKIGDSGLFADFEGIYVKGDDEIIVRDTNWRGNGVPGGRPNTTRNQINTYTNEGHSEYKAFVMSLNGTLKGGHVVTASFTVADKKNINDDFSPTLTEYPNDPADIEAEWGRSRADERYRFVASAVFRMPLGFTIAPIFDYGSGQPWYRRLGYDRNGDGKFSDRPDGVARNSEEGPSFSTVNLRVIYRVPVGERAGLDLIAEAFNLFNTDNFEVNSVQNAEFLSGPTPAAPNTPLVRNPRFRQYIDTLPPFEAQLGVRFTF